MINELADACNRTILRYLSEIKSSSGKGQVDDLYARLDDSQLSYESLFLLNSPFAAHDDLIDSQAVGHIEQLLWIRCYEVLLLFKPSG